MADPRIRQPVKIVDPTTNANEAGVDASGNLQVIAGANTGVDIGDVDVTSIIPLTGTTNLGKAEDQASGAGDVGVAAMAVQDAVLSALGSADADYTHLRVDANGALWVAPLPTGTNSIGDIANITTAVTPGTAAANLGKAEDVASAGGDTGVAIMAVQDATLSALGSIDDDYTWLRVNSQGALHVTGGGGGTEYDVDDPLGATPTGSVTLAKRDDALSALTPVEGDAVELRVDANGALWTILAANSGVDIGDVDVLSVTPGTAATNLGKAESSAHTTADVGVMALAVRDDTPVGLAADGEYIPLTTDSVGRLHVTDPNAGGGAPGSPTIDTDTSVAVAAGSSVDLDSSTVADGKKLWGVDVTCSVPYKGIIRAVNDGVDDDFTTIFGKAGDVIQWRSPHADFAVKGTGGAGVDVFQVDFTNQDTDDAADAYASFYYAS